MARAVVVRGAGAAIEVVDVEPPELGPRDVRVRIIAAGVCHSDLSMIDGTMRPEYPLVLGHEASGVVVELGPGAADFAVGDKVVVNWAAACRACTYCRRRQPWLCTYVEGVVSRPGGSLDGATLHRALGVGVFAEEVVLPQAALVRMPAGVPDDLGALLGCAVLTGTGAVWRTTRVHPGDAIVVIGLGGVGLSAIAGARVSGAAAIIAVDVSPEKEELARTLGATDFVLSERGAAKQVRAIAEGGVDYAYDCVGAPDSIRLAWDSTRRGGTCVIVGIGGRERDVAFSPMELYHYQRILRSSIFGSSDPPRDIPGLGALIRTGNFDIASLVTDRISLDEVAEAFDRMRAGTGARSLITFG